MSKVLFFSLRARLVALVLIAVVPAFGVIVYTGLEQRDDAREQAQQDALRLVELASAQQGQFVEGGRQLLSGLAHVSVIHEQDSGGCSALLAQLLTEEPRYTGFGVADAGGDLFCSAPPSQPPVNIADRLCFQRAVATKEFAVGEYAIGRVTGKATLGLGYPVFDARGEFTTLLIASVDVAWLNDLAADADLPVGAALTIMDRKGVVLARYPELEGVVGEAFPDAPTCWKCWANIGSWWPSCRRRRREGRVMALSEEPVQVLLVEDNADDVAIIERMLAAFKHTRLRMQHAASTGECVQRLQGNGIDLVLLDYSLPGEDGLTFLRRLMRRHTAPPVILLTGQGNERVAVEAIREGACDYFPKGVVSPQVLGGAIDRAVRRFREEEDLRRYDEQIVFALAATAEGRDSTNGGHLQRIALYAVQIGQAVGLDDRELMLLRYGAVLHDIGKLMVDQATLRKPGKLNSDEWDEVRQHPIVGERMCASLTLGARSARSSATTMSAGTAGATLTRCRARRSPFWRASSASQTRTTPCPVTAPTAGRCRRRR